MKVERIEPASKARAPREVTVAELRAELKELRAWNREILGTMDKLSAEVSAERAANRKLRAEVRAGRAHSTEMLGALRRVSAALRVEAYERLERNWDCTCTPGRSDLLTNMRTRALARL